MTEHRDPMLEPLFSDARKEFAGQRFTAQVMVRADRLRLSAAIAWISIGLVLIAVAWVFGSALQDAVAVINRGLSISLIDVGNEWLAPILSPINSVAGLLAIALLGARRIFRKILS